MTITEDQKKIIKAQRKIREDERREKFKLLAEARVTKIIKLIRLIGNLSRKSAYKYEQADIVLIKKTIDQELNKALSRFDFDSKNAESKTFTLK